MTSFCFKNKRFFSVIAIVFTAVVLLFMIPIVYQPLLKTAAQLLNRPITPPWIRYWKKLNITALCSLLFILAVLHPQAAGKIATSLKNQSFLLATAAALLVKIYFVTYNTNITYIWETPRKVFTFSPHWFLFLAFTLAPAFFFGKKRPGFLIAANFFFSFVFLVYLNYWRGFKTLPTSASLVELGNFMTGALIKGVTPLVLAKPFDFLLFLDLPLFIFGAIKWQAHNKARRPFAALATLILGAIIIADSILFKKRPADLWSMTINNNFWLRKYSSLGHFYVNEWELFSRKRHLNRTDKAQIEAWFQNNQALSGPSPYDGLLKGKNLIVIALESFDSFLVNRSFDGLEITPHLNAMLAHSLYWPNIYEQTSANSIHGLFAIETSMYSPFYGVMSLAYPETSYKEIGISGSLKKEGYNNILLMANNGATWGLNNYYRQIAYDTQHIYGRDLDLDSLPITDKTPSALSDEGLFRYSIQDIDQLRSAAHGPFAAFIFTSSMHMPFTYDMAGTMEKPFSTPHNRTLGDYLNNAHYVDKQIKYFMGELDKRNLLKDTLIAITGDHTGINKYYPGSYPDLKHMQPWEGQYALNQDLRVPLLLFNPSLQGRRFEQIGGQIDIAPTILSLLGMPASQYGMYMFGRNLLGSNRSFALLVNGQIQGTPSNEEARHLIEGRKVADMLIKTNTADPSKR